MGVDVQYDYEWTYLISLMNGGGGIRTHGTLADTLVFKTRALNHSTTPPEDYLIVNNSATIVQKSVHSLLIFRILIAKKE